MILEYKKALPVKLRDVGKDEKWLQDRVNEDTSILGLGDLVILQREKPQFTGGRIDFLMFNPEDEVRYEIEIMLGTLDESHIIRTIEYWDVERRRYPSFEHRAVIVAEDITNRFFNIIGLMNKAIPIIAIQMNAFSSENQLLLNFVKVLDLAETFEDVEQGPQETVDRKYWISRANPASMEILDSLIGIVQTISPPRITYNRSHVAFATSGRNFMWCHLRKAPRIYCEIRVGVDRENLATRFDDKGIQCNRDPFPENLKINLTKKELEENKELIQEAISLAENHSH
jgi:hypothetical protein